MKKLLLTTMAATMMSTAAIADVTYDVNSYDYEVGRIHKGMQLANHFENRNINIVENGQGQLAASMTVNAWNDAWDEAENNNTIEIITTSDPAVRDPRTSQVEIVIDECCNGAIRRYYISDEIVAAMREHEGWDLINTRIELGIQKSYDTGFEDGFTAGYDVGFAAAKAVVTNGD